MYRQHYDNLFNSFSPDEIDLEAVGIDAMTAMKETKNPVTGNGKVIKETGITVGTAEIMKEGTATDVKIRGTIVGRMKKILRSIEKIGLW